MSRFAEIEVFIQVAQQGSFTAAAEQLGLSRPRVSQLIQMLEARHGIRLVERTTRRVQLTAAGQQFLISCQLGMNQLASAEANLRLSSHQLSGPIRMNSVGGIYGEVLLSEALSDIVLEHPELQVDVNYTSELVDLNKDPIDLVLRIGRAPAEGVSSAFLGEVHHTLCASPAFLHKHGYPESPIQLTDMPTICGTPKIWEMEHLLTDEKQVITPKAAWRSANSNAQKIAAEAGVGIARILSLLVEPSLQQGKLMPVLPDWRIEPTSLWLMWRNGGNLPVSIETVREHLIERLRLKLNESSST